MTDREILIEILAMSLYAHDTISQGMRPNWLAIDEEDRKDFRDAVDARSPEDAIKEIMG